MEFITTTQLRTMSPQLLAQLSLGRSVRLLHRSKMVATIKPAEPESKILTAKDVEEIMQIAKEINLPKLSDKEIDRRYRAAMMKKHGQHLSRHK